MAHYGAILLLSAVRARAYESIRNLVPQSAIVPFRAWVTKKSKTLPLGPALPGELPRVQNRR